MRIGLPQRKGNSGAVGRFHPYGELLPALQRIFMPLTQAFSMLRIGRYDFSGSVIAIILWLWLTRLVPALIIQLNMWILQ